MDACCILEGLDKRPELNGQAVRLLKFDAGSERWEVRLTDEDVNDKNGRGPVPPTPEHLKQTGVKVRPQNLTSTWRLRIARRLRDYANQVQYISMDPLRVDSRKLLYHPPSGCTLQFMQNTNIVLNRGVLWMQYGPNAPLHQTVRCYEPLKPFEDGIGYYEATVTGSSVGLSSGPRYDPQHEAHGGNLHHHMGWQPTSYGYHSDDGTKWRNDESYQTAQRVQGDAYQAGEAFAEPFGISEGFTAEDVYDLGHPGPSDATGAEVIGCGADFVTRSIFFTKNGELVGVAFDDVPALPFNLELRPTVTMHTRFDICRFNQGKFEPFVFDVSGFAAQRRRDYPA